jgi:hypothetical protein
MDYYSSRLLYVVLVNDGRPRRRNHYDESTVVFRARDFDDAFERAVEIGLASEQRYENAKGQEVRWALVEVSTLDCVGPAIDGHEVSSRLHDRVSEAAVPFGARFTPRRSRPSQSF